MYNSFSETIPNYLCVVTESVPVPKVINKFQLTN